MNHYEILGVDHLAGVGEIRAAYLQRALEVHPDKAGGSKAEFQKLVAAFEVLSDGSLRSAYNKTLASTKVSRSPKSASPTAHQHAAAAQPPCCAGPRVSLRITGLAEFSGYIAFSLKAHLTHGGVMTMQEVARCSKEARQRQHTHLARHGSNGRACGKSSSIFRRTTADAIVRKWSSN